MTEPHDQSPAGPPPAGDLVWIPAGTFRMGSDEHYPEESPARDVEVGGFWIGRTTVTNADYAAFVDGLNAFRTMTLPPGSAAAEAFAVFPGALLADPAAVLGALLPVGPRAPLGLRGRLGVLFSGRLP